MGAYQPCDVWTANSFSGKSLCHDRWSAWEFSSSRSLSILTGEDRRELSRRSALSPLPRARIRPRSFKC